jgi:hypothetical protein
LAILNAALAERLGLKPGDMHRRLVGIGMDGANVMQGVHAGVGAFMRRSAAPFAAVMHCAAHKLNLAAMVLTEIPAVSYTFILIKDMQTYFNRSSPRVTALKKTATEELDMSEDAVTPLRMADTRWMSCCAPMERIVDNYKLYTVFTSRQREETRRANADTSLPALHEQFTNAAIAFTTHGILPLLNALNTFVKACQLREIYMGDLFQVLNETRDRIAVGLPSLPS